MVYLHCEVLLLQLKGCRSDRVAGYTEASFNPDGWRNICPAIKILSRNTDIERLLEISTIQRFRCYVYVLIVFTLVWVGGSVWMYNTTDPQDGRLLAQKTALLWF